jgi:hypothetical protein
LPSFKEAIDELPVKVKLTIVRDGQQLVELLTQKSIHFLMFFSLTSTCPAKWVCLEIRQSNEKLLNLPVIVLSTANDEAKVKMVFRMMLRTIIFVSLPNLSNSKKYLYKAIKLIAEGNLDFKQKIS